MHLYDNALHLNQSEVCALFGCSVATLKRVHMRDMDFPNPIFPTGRRALWRLDELKAYAAARVQLSRAPKVA
jgi:predicted DNA-binding transcriptional regulator AlpA